MVAQYTTRKRISTGLAGAIALIVCSPLSAWAHTGVGAAQGLGNGFTHPLMGWDHLLAMIAVGLWAGQRGGRALWVLPATFVGVMAIGGFLGVAGLALPGVEGGILASVLVLGALVAAAVRFPLPAAAAVVAIFALFHGHAHGTEMPVTASGIAYGIGFCTATALLHATGVIAPSILSRSVAERPTTWVRVAGAAIGIAGIFLALG